MTPEQIGVDLGEPVIFECHNCRAQTETSYDVGLPVSLCEMCALGYYRHACEHLWERPIIAAQEDKDSE